MRDTRLLRPDDGGTSGGNGATEEPVITNPQADAVVRYRELVASQPGLVPEMVRGETVEEIDASATEARRAYGEISRRVAEQFERAVPPGNPPRSSADMGVETLKPEAKIALGLKRIGQ
ncbi:MAG TPA: hypothetical protein VJ183_07810 [Chloroflexia bacterium]|nr:hypothetical protein [Chloroflexia bacterium]